VLDIRGGLQMSAGAEVITFRRGVTRSPTQLWFCDESGVIRSSHNDFGLEARYTEHVRMMPYTGQPDQQWIISGNRIINRVRPAECFSDKDGDMPVHSKEYKSKPTQHWRIEYVM